MATLLLRHLVQVQMPKHGGGRSERDGLAVEPGLATPWQQLPMAFLVFLLLVVVVVVVVVLRWRWRWWWR